MICATANDVIVLFLATTGYMTKACRACVHSVQTNNISDKVGEKIYLKSWVAE